MRYLKGSQGARLSLLAILILLLWNPADGMDLKRWLQEIDLEKYYSNFVDNSITNEEILILINDDDLKSIGISSLGHRKKLLSAIADLKKNGWKPKWNLKYWLQSIGMDEYHSDFVKNSITDRAIVSTLTEDDLKSIGVTSLGHRKKLKSAISALGKDSSISPEAIPTLDNTSDLTDESFDAPNSDIVVEVHQSHTGTNLWYHVGVVNSVTKMVDWGQSHKYDQGAIPMCDFDGNTIVEVHQGHNDLKLWYRVGTIEEKTRTINWGRSVNYDDKGRTPIVAMRGNIVVEMHQSHTGTNLWYHVGILDRSSGLISWGKSTKFDRGQIPSIGFPEFESDTIVEVHQSHSGTNLWYHVGTINGDSRTIDWGESHKYDMGRLPMCDFDGDTIVEVHQGHDDLQLWYRVGIVEERTRTIVWGNSVNYDRGKVPTVAINNNIVVEMHQSHRGTNLWYHVGILDNATQTITWGQSHKFDKGRIPSIGF